MRQPVYIIDGLRTGIGSRYRGLNDFSAAQLSAFVINALVRQNSIPEEKIGQVVLGNTVSAATGQNLARHAAIMAGLPETIPAFTVNNVCGSGLQSAIVSAQAILAGDIDLAIAGGTESATHSPKLLIEAGKGADRRQQEVDSLVYDGLWCHLTDRHMGELSDYIAEKFHISRDEQDAYSMRSHQKAASAQEKGKFKNEIVPVALHKGVFEKDERVRKNFNLAEVKTFKPAFKKAGTATAANSSVPGDGAAAIILASEKWVKAHHAKPKAKIAGYVYIAQEPTEVFTAGVAAAKQCLEKTGLKVTDIDLFEVSEAFASQAIVTQKELKIPQQKMNILGGDIALGHPLGCAGTRMLVTLLHALCDQKKKYGLATVCLGGGGAVAVIMERV